MSMVISRSVKFTPHPGLVHFERKTLLSLSQIFAMSDTITVIHSPFGSSRQKRILASKYFYYWNYSTPCIASSASSNVNEISSPKSSPPVDFLILDFDLIITGVVFGVLFAAATDKMRNSLTLF